MKKPRPRVLPVSPLPAAAPRELTDAQLHARVLELPACRRTPEDEVSIEELAAVLAMPWATKAPAPPKPARSPAVVSRMSRRRAVAAMTRRAPVRMQLFWPEEEPQRPVIRRNEMRGDWWLLNRRRAGWGERGYYHSTLAALVAAWALRIVGRGQDAHGEYLVVEEAPAAEAPQDVSAWEAVTPVPAPRGGGP